MKKEWARLKQLIRKSKFQFFVLYNLLISCTPQEAVINCTDNDCVDSVIVYFVANNQRCFDCRNYTEIFLSLTNKKQEVKQIPFYQTTAENGFTNFYLETNDKLFNLKGNNDNPILIGPNEKHQLLVMLDIENVSLLDSSKYSSLVDNIVRNGIFKYVLKNGTKQVDSLELKKSPNFKIIKKLLN